MVNEKISPNGIRLDRILDNHFGTNLTTDNEWEYAQTTSDEVINYYYVHHMLLVSNSDKSIQTTTKILEKCYAENTTCQTEQGTLVWHRQNTEKCRLKKGLSTICVLTDGRISCPQEFLAISDPTLITLCNVHFGYSAQGIVFTADDLVTKDRLGLNVVLTQQAESIVNSPTSVKKRDIPASTTTRSRITKLVCTYEEKISEEFYCILSLKPTVVTAAEFNGKLQYIYDLVRSNISYNIQQLHSEICQINKRQLEMLRLQAQGGQVSLLVRVLLGNEAYRSRLNEDILSIYKCTKIYNYMFLPRTE